MVAAPERPQENICRLHVSMYQAADAVNGIEGLGNLCRNRAGPTRLKSGHTLEEVTEVLTLDPLHSEKQEPIQFTYVVDRHHVRVIDRRSEARFA